MALASLLRMLAQNNGDELSIVPDQPPALARAGVPLRLFFPPVTEGLHAQIVGPLLTPERRQALERGEEVRFEHDAGPQGVFQVRLRGHPLARAGFVRGAAEAAAEPGGAEPARVEPTRGESTRVEPARVEPATASVRESAPLADAAGLEPALRRLIERALLAGASDLHLTEGEPAVWRVDGVLRHAGAEIDVRRSVAALIGAHGVARVQAGEGVDDAITLPDGERVRVHAFLCDRGLALALRVLRRRAPRLAELGLPVPLDDLVSLPHGLVLVGGPTGSGKSTTLAALAQACLDRRRGLLVTLEDPIEYVFRADGEGALVRQRQVGTHARDFATGLRDALREDPDVLLIGEMRDPESIALALAAAETGHLVFASLHVRSAPASISRIVDGCPDAHRAQVRAQLAESLRAVVVQRLLPRASGEGRVVAMEVMRGTRAVGAHIREGREGQLSSVVQSGAADGMWPLERCLRDQVRSGQITLETAQAVCNERGTLDALLR